MAVLGDRIPEQSAVIEHDLLVFSSEERKNPNVRKNPDLIKWV